MMTRLLLAGQNGSPDVSTSSASLSFARAEPRRSLILNIFATRSAPGPATFARITRGPIAGSSEAMSWSARSTRTPSSPLLPE